MTTARPILFSAPMVCALIEGRKTQTRRLLKPTPPSDYRVVYHEGLGHRVGFSRENENYRPRIPYGIPGDLLWVRETFAHAPPHGVRYAATDNIQELRKKRPAIHMPRSVSRLTLEITNVRVERLHDISEEDARAEGVEFETADPPFYYVPGIWPHSITGVGVEEPGGKHVSRSYAKLWNHINGADAWDANPWIVALTFKVHAANVDTVLAQRTEPSTAPAPSGRRAERVSEGANTK